MNPKWISIGDEWAHFRSEDGTELSCRTLNANYPDIGKHVKVVGIEVELPENILAEIQALNDAIDDYGHVGWEPGRFAVKI